MSDNAMMLASQPTMMATTSLGADVDQLEKALSFFERMGKAALLPEGVKGPADALMLATAGHRLGFDLMTSLRAFHIIKGQVVLRADMMRAVVFSAGKRSGVDIHIVETSKTRAVMVGVRNGREVCVEVTMEDARAAGLTGSDTWKKYPAQMLVAAATRQLGRLLFPDLLAGIYTPDEMGQHEPPPAVAEVAAFTRREPSGRIVADTAPDDVPDAVVDDGQVEDPLRQRLYILAEAIDPEGSPWSEVAVLWYLASRPQAPASSPTLAACLDKLSVKDTAWAKTVQGMVPALQRRMTIVGGLNGAGKWLRALPAGCVAEVKASAASALHARAPGAGSPGALLGIALAVAEESAAAPAKANDATEVQP